MWAADHVTHGSNRGLRSAWQARPGSFFSTAWDGKFTYEYLPAVGRVEGMTYNSVLSETDLVVFPSFPLLLLVPSVFFRAFQSCFRVCP